jgi:hypothetical protein
MVRLQRDREREEMREEMRAAIRRDRERHRRSGSGSDPSTMLDRVVVVSATPPLHGSPQHQLMAAGQPLVARVLSPPPTLLPGPQAPLQAVLPEEPQGLASTDGGASGDEAPDTGPFSSPRRRSGGSDTLGLSASVNTPVSDWRNLQLKLTLADSPSVAVPAAKTKAMTRQSAAAGSGADGTQLRGFPIDGSGNGGDGDGVDNAVPWKGPAAIPPSGGGGGGGGDGGVCTGGGVPSGSGVAECFGDSFGDSLRYSGDFGATSAGLPRPDMQATSGPLGSSGLVGLQLLGSYTTSGSEGIPAAESHRLPLPRPWDAVELAVAGRDQGAEAHPAPGAAVPSAATRAFTHHDVESLRMSLEASLGLRGLQRALALLEPYRTAIGGGAGGAAGGNGVDVHRLLHPVVGHNDRAVHLLTDLVLAEHALL